MKTKTFLRFYFTPASMTKINKTNDSRCWQGCVVRETFIDSGHTNIYSHDGNQFLMKMGTNLPQNWGIPLLGIYAKNISSCRD